MEATSLKTEVSKASSLNKSSLMLSYVRNKCPGLSLEQIEKKLGNG